MILPVAASVIALLLAGVSAFRQPSGFVQERFSWARTRWDTASVLGFLITSWVLPLGLSFLHPPESDELARATRDLLAGSALLPLVAALILVGLAFGEELVFRGYLARFLPGHARRLSIVLSAVLFGLCHVPPWSRIPAALMLSWMALRTGSLWIPVLVHTFSNGVSFAIGWLIVGGVIPAPQPSPLLSYALTFVGCAPTVWALRSISRPDRADGSLS